MIAAAGNAQPSQSASPSLDSIVERSRIVLPRSRRYDPEKVFRVNQNVPPAEER